MQTAVLADRVVSESGVAGVPDFANITDNATGQMPPR